MLPKKHRLSKSAEVKKTTAKGRSFFNPFFVLKIAKGTEIPKLTVIVSTKVSKKAVDRNRIKRVIRETVRPFIGNFPLGTYAVIVKAKANSLTSLELKEQVLWAIKTAKLVKP